MGLTEIIPPEGPLFVTLYQDGAICSVYHASQGTAAGTAALAAFLDTVGYAATPAEIDGCGGQALPDGTRISLTTGGQDPACHGEIDTDVRFLFAPN